MMAISRITVKDHLSYIYINNWEEFVCLEEMIKYKDWQNNS